VTAASAIYALYGRPETLRVEHFNCAHLFPPDMRQAAYRIFDEKLR